MVLFFDGHEAFVDEFVHAYGAEFAAVAGAFDPAEGDFCGFFWGGVGSDHAGVELFGKGLGAGLVGGKDC